MAGQSSSMYEYLKTHFHNRTIKNNHSMVSGYKVFVENLSRETRQMDIECFFEDFGKVKEISMKTGYGIVTFGELEEAERACVALDGKELAGEYVRLSHLIRTLENVQFYFDERSTGKNVSKKVVKREYSDEEYSDASSVRNKRKSKRTVTVENGRGGRKYAKNFGK